MYHGSRCVLTSSLDDSIWLPWSSLIHRVPTLAGQDHTLSMPCPSRRMNRESWDAHVLQWLFSSANPLVRGRAYL